MKLFLENLYATPERSIDLTYQLLQERPAAANISHAGQVDPEAHRRFFLSTPYREWLGIVPADDPGSKAVGTVLLTWRNEIGIAILKEHQRRGYARAALRLLLDTRPPLPAEPSVRPGYYVANVAPGNTASISMFTEFGTILQHTFRIHP